MAILKRAALLLLLFPLPLLAQGTYTAASTAESDVNAVINGPTHVAVNGDIIQIPCSGTQSVTWTSTLAISASITLTALGGTPNTTPSTFGAGTNCLTIRHNVANFAPLFQLTPTYAATNNVTTVQNINIDPFTGSTGLGNPFVIEGAGTSSGMPQVRIDNIGFGIGVQWNEAGNTFHSVQMILVDNVVGVADHNTLPTGSSVELSSVQMSSYLGVGLWGDNSWAQPDSMGGANNWFEENNSIYMTSLVLNDCTESGPSYSNSGGCRVVNRFNHVTENGAFALTGVHGLDTAGRPRSGRHTETYGNVVSCINTACGDAFASFRGGTGILFGNTGNTSAGGFFSQLFDATPYRVVFNASGWGGCGDATSGNAFGPTDTNDGVNYYPGSGSATAASGSSGAILNVSGTPWTGNQWVNFGAPYDVWDVTQGFVAEITANTTNSITVIPGIPEQANNFAVGDSFQIRRATVCTDQAGRGQGNYVSGQPNPSPASAINQALDPMYDWNNVVNPATQLTQQVGTYSARVIINRDYLTDNWKTRGQSAPTVQTSSTAPFDGSGSSGQGVGWGTLANRPTCGGGCLTNAGYFATDQGSWNTSGNGFGQGILYTWNGSAWVTHYTPYTYPHPLIPGGTPQAAAPTFTPAGGSYTSTQTVTISSITASNSITYGTAAIGSTCTPGTSYTTPVSIASTEQLCAYATASGFTQSNTTTQTYNIGSITLVAAPAAVDITCSPTCAAQTPFASLQSGDLVVIAATALVKSPSALNPISSVSCSPSCGTWVLPGANCQAFTSASEGIDCAYVLSASAATNPSITVTMANSGAGVESLHFRQYRTSQSNGFSLDGTPSTTTSVGCTTCSTPNLTLTGNNDVLVAWGSPANVFTGVSSPFGNAVLDANATGTVSADILNTTSGTGAGFTQNASGTAALGTIAFTDLATSICGNPTQKGPPTNPTFTFSNPSLAAGTYNIGFSSPTAGCSMFMTLNGSAPTCASTAYSDQSISSTTTMRVIACKTGFTSSQVQGGTWTISGASSFALTVSATNGTINATNNCVTSSGYSSGTTIGPCTATPNTNYAFASWSGTGSAPASSTTNPLSFNITAPSTLTANFVQITTATPVATPCGIGNCGIYAGNVTVTLSSTTAGATITYCLSASPGCTPTTTYSSPFTITAPTIKYLTAFANASGLQQSPTASWSYTLVTPPTNIQVTIGGVNF